MSRSERRRRKKHEGSWLTEREIIIGSRRAGTDRVERFDERRARLSGKTLDGCLSTNDLIIFDMNRARKTAVCLALVIANAFPLASQEFEIGIIDFYGLGRISENDARQALAFKFGDTITLSGDKPPAVLAQSEHRLSTLPGVTRARANVVCCDGGRVIVYVGVEGRERRATIFRPPPR